MSKNPQTIIQLQAHASKIMLKILQVGFQEYVNQELPDVLTGFRDRGGTRDQTANIHEIIEKSREFKKKKKRHIYFCFIDNAKAFVRIKTNCGRFLKRWEYQTTLPILLRNL